MIDEFGHATASHEAIAGMRTETRRYAKRQTTWFRHQMEGWGRLDSGP